jgi:hypothetical protein
VVIRGTFEMLSWSNQKDWTRKASNTQKKASHDNSSGILTNSSLCKHWSKEVSQPHHDSALDYFMVLNSYGWRIDFILMIGLHQAIIGLHIAIGVMNWNLCDHPLLQHSKGIFIMYMVISFLTSMWLVHIVHAK